MSLTLQKRRLQGYRAEKQEYVNLDMSSSEAFGSTWYGCTFTKCDFSLSNLQQSEFVDCRFVGCDLRMVNFRASKLRLVRFEECDMRQSVFVGVTPLESVEFRDCQLQYASFFDCTARETSFRDSNLHGTDLRFIESQGARYVGSNLWGAISAFGCQFWNSQFDERACDFFVALVSRVHPSPEKAKILREIAGISVKVTERLMDQRSA